jgi:hypothetical protein
MDKKSADDQSESSWDFKPGDTVAPGTSAPVEAAEAPKSETPSGFAGAVSAAPDSAEADSVPAETEPGQDNEAAQSSMPAPVSSAEEPSVTWSAAEFIAHDKSPVWYLYLAGISIALAAVTFLLTKDKISTAIVLLAGLAFGIYAARKPQEVQYSLDRTGLTIGGQHVAYNQFRSFSVIDEGPLASLSLFPLKRFGQFTTIYFEHADESAIVNMIAAHLPLDERHQDLIDRFMRRIHF